MNGWVIFAHPLFLDQLESLVAAVEAERGARPRRSGVREASANEKVLASIAHLAFDEIPQNPASRDYRQGKTLGAEYKDWSRAKFGASRFRLFFRFRSDVRIIVYAWVNDRDTLRTKGSRQDAYAVFRRMLEGGNPPDDWTALVAAVRTPATDRRMKSAAARLSVSGTRTERAD